MHVLIITGGRIDKEFAKKYLAGKHYQRIIAADAGLSRCHDLDITPTDILGDFDSLKKEHIPGDTNSVGKENTHKDIDSMEKENTHKDTESPKKEVNLSDSHGIDGKTLLEKYRQQGIPIYTHPERKDYTDTHLAVLMAEDLKADHITILGATGSRYDHTLANIALLSHLADQGIPSLIIDEHNQIEILNGPEKKEYKKDKNYPYFSLIAWGGNTEGITLTGFSYPLTNATLTPDISLGISNEITTPTATVTLKKGHLLIIRARD